MMYQWKKYLVVVGVMALLVGIANPAISADTKPELQIKWFNWHKCDSLKKLAAEYPAANITVTCVPNPEWYDSVFDDFKAKSGADLMVLDSQWIGEAVVEGHIIELTDWVSENIETSLYVPAALSAYGEFPPGSEQYYGVPMEGDTTMLVYRRDILEQAGFQPPKTWEELLEQARVLTEGDLIPYGYVSWTCGDCYDDVQFTWNQVAWSYGGELWDPETYIIEGVLNSEENIAALEFAAELYKYGPQVDVNQTMTNPMICEGEAAMIMTVFGYGMGLIDPATCPQAENISFAVIPAGPEDHVASLGGMGIHVSAYSQNQQAALDFLAWMHTKEKQLRYAELGGCPVRYDVLATDTFVNAAKVNEAFSVTYPLVRDFWNLPEYSKLLPIQGKYLNLAILGKMPPKEALDNIAAEQQAILDTAYPDGPPQ